MKLPDFKADLKTGVTDLENFFAGWPADARTDAANAAAATIAKLRNLAETDVEKEADKIVPGAYTAATNAVIAEGFNLLAEKAQAELTAKAAQIEAAKAEVAAAATATAQAPAQ